MAQAPTLGQILLKYRTKEHFQEAYRCKSDVKRLFSPRNKRFKLEFHIFSDKRRQKTCSSKGSSFA